MKKNLVVAPIAGLFFLFATASAVQAEAFQFSVATDNGEITTESLAGKVVYIDFWASWCVPCRKSFPWMNEMQSKYQDKDFKVVAINLDKEKSLAQEFLKKLPATFSIGYDPAGKLAEQFQVIGMPMAFLMNRDGELIHRHTGFKVSKIASYEQSIIEALEVAE